MRVVQWLLAIVVAFVLVVTVASALYDVATSDPNVPVRSLWHGKFVRADGVLTAYRSWGSHGPPIVLVGGFLEPTWVWDDVAPLLARAGHRVYALDLTGFGYSERKGPYTLAHWADQVSGFDRALHLRRPLVVGHSLGAAIAVEEARRGDASEAVLLDGDALRSGGPPRWARTAIAYSPFFTTAFRLLPRWDWLVRRVIRNAYGPADPPLDHTSLGLWTRQFRADGARGGLRGVLENGIPGFTPRQLQRMHVNALVVFGADDHVDSPEAGRQTARDLHAQFVAIPHAGHLSMLTAPGAVAVAIAP
jgi:pimeloyl-ACP methyl ester carboxylesterase